jgi:hypothetical protein
MLFQNEIENEAAILIIQQRNGGVKLELKS